MNVQKDAQSSHPSEEPIEPSYQPPASAAPNLWQRWGPVLTASLALLCAVAGATYYLSGQINKITSLENSTEELKNEVGEVSDRTGVLGRLEASAERLEGELQEMRRDVLSTASEVSSLLGGTELRDRQVESLEAALAETRGGHSEQLRELGRRLGELSDRLNRVEVNLRVNNLLATGELEGAVIETPEGELKTYDKEHIDDFRRDAEKLINEGGGSGGGGGGGGWGGYRMSSGSWAPGRPCEGPGNDCLQIGLIDREAPDRFASVIKMRVREEGEGEHLVQTPERIAFMFADCFEANFAFRASEQSAGALR